MANLVPVDADADAYIDYETFLSPTFSPHSFANALILHTNPPNDPNLDLSTPLSRVLFDLQEIDSHIHNITTSHAIELLSHARETRDVSFALVDGLEEELKVLNGVYKRLEKEVLGRSEVAEEVVKVVERLAIVTGLLRRCARCAVLGRKLEGEIEEIVGGGRKKEKVASSSVGVELDYQYFQALLRACLTVIELRKVLIEEKTGGNSNTGGGNDEVEDGLGQLRIIQTLTTHLLLPTELFLKTAAQSQLLNFSLPQATTTTASTNLANPSSSIFSASAFAARKSLGELRNKVSISLQILYLLPPTPPLSPKQPDSTVQNLLISTLTTYLINQTTSSLSALSRVFSSLTPSTSSPPALDRSFSEIASKIIAIIELENILSSILLADLSSSLSPLQSKDEELGEEAEAQTLYSFILSDFDTPTLPIHFFKNFSNGLETLVRNVLTRGGVAARGLRAGKEKIVEGLKGVVERGLIEEEQEEEQQEYDRDGDYGEDVRKRRSRRKRRKAAEREVGIGIVIGGLERGFGAGK